MKLTYEQIKNITWGADRVELIDEYFRFFRFTKEQELAYYYRSLGQYKKVSLAPCVKLVFKTDSKNLWIRGVTDNTSTRNFYSIDVFANGKPVGYIDNFSNTELPEEYSSISLPAGDVSGTFSLGEGEKTVTVYLPWSCKFMLSSLNIDEGAYVTPVRPEKHMLVFGDSITQGYDCLRPSAHHIVRLGEALSAEVKNKGVGGEIFWPELASLADDGDFDYVTVAYGTNDWGVTDRATLQKNCAEFYATLSKKYPNAKIFALGPIWRKNCNEIRSCGEFFNIIEDIENGVKDLPNVTFIDCFDFVPHDSKYFADLYLHPNDEGFDHYYKNLLAEIKKYI